MASKINYIIPSRRFELFCDVIGLIIKEEFAKQKQLTGNTVYDANVYIDRSLSYDAATELPAVNVSYKRTVYSNQDIKSNLGDNIYMIEVTAKGIESATKRADYNSAKILYKLLGAIAYILSSAEYRFLGLAPGIVMGLSVREIKIYPPDPVYNHNPIHLNDELSTVSGCLIFSVKAAEEVSDVDGVDSEGINLESIFTGMTIEDTDKGYKIIINNT